MRRMLQRRLRALEEQAPRSGGGPVAVILPEGMSLEEFKATLQPWFTAQGEARQTLIVMDDDRPSTPITFEAPKASTLHLVGDYDYGDDLEEPA